MKITHFALALFVALLMAAGYFLLQSKHQEELTSVQDKNNQKLADMEQRLKDLQASLAKPASTQEPPKPEPATPGAATPEETKPSTAAENPAATASTEAPTEPAAPDAPGLIDEIPPLPGDPSEKLTTEAAEAAVLRAEIEKIKSANAQQPKLTELQQRIKDLPALAKIKSCHPEHGFVVLDAGKNRGLEKDMRFAVRRDTMLVGRVVIDDTIEEAECVASLAGAIPVGVELQPGDEIVKWDQ